MSHYIIMAPELMAALLAERKGLRTEFFQVERRYREIKARLSIINNQIEGSAPAGPVQMAFALERSDTGMLVPAESSPDVWADLAREESPEVEIILNPKENTSAKDNFEGTGSLFVTTILTQLNRTHKVSTSIMIDSLRLAFPNRTATQLRSQLNVVLRRMIDGKRLSKLGRGSYSLIAPQQTVRLDRGGNPV